MRRLDGERSMSRGGFIQRHQAALGKHSEVISACIKSKESCCLSVDRLGYLEGEAAVALLCIFLCMSMQMLRFCCSSLIIHQGIIAYLLDVSLCRPPRSKSLT